MREIEFRGRCFKTGEWIFGDLLRNREETFIVPDGIANPLATADDFRVDAETVGQYTGLKDKNGVRCYDLNCMERLVLCSDGIREPATGCKKP